MRKISLILLLISAMLPAGVWAVGQSVLSGTCTFDGSRMDIQLSWTNVGDATANSLQKMIDDGGWNWLLQDPPPFDVFTYADNNLAVGHVYKYQHKTDAQVASNTFLCRALDPVPTTQSATSVTSTGGTLHGLIDAGGLPTEAWFEYGPSASLGQSTSRQDVSRSSTAAAVSAAVSGLTGGQTYHFRIVAENESGRESGQILTFTTSDPPAPTPTVTTNAATGVTSTGATLRGSVNANGIASEYWFEYGASQSLGQSTSRQSAGSGSTTYSYYRNISGLSGGQTYYFRIVAESSAGRAEGSIRSFAAGSQIPVVLTETATGVTTSGATLRGSVNPNGFLTEAWFEYGASQSLGQSTSRQPIGAGGISDVSVSQSLTGLTNGRTYYYRIAAQSEKGTARGSIMSVVIGTSQGGPSITTLGASGIGTTFATLNSSVNPGGISTEAWFEYGTDASLGTVVGKRTISAGSSDVSVSQKLTGLTTRRVYYYRGVARNSRGTTLGEIRQFIPMDIAGGGPPQMITGPATEVTRTSAKLNGLLNPYNLKTTWWFEYGTTDSLGKLTAKKTLTGAIDFNMDAVLTKLVSGQIYYFRLVAENSRGRNYGLLQSFATLKTSAPPPPAPSPSVPPPAEPPPESRATLVISPPNQTIAIEEQAAFSLYYDSDGPDGRKARVNVTSDADWSSNDQGVLIHEAYGRFRGRSAGDAGVSAEYEGLSAQASVKVSAPGNSPLVRTSESVSENGGIEVRGYVNPNGEPARYWFEYGTDEALGEASPEQQIEASTIGSDVSERLSGLRGGTYYFRVAAENRFGRRHGDLLTFRAESGAAWWIYVLIAVVVLPLAAVLIYVILKLISRIRS